MADTKDIALLFAEGETAKAQSLRDWLDHPNNEIAGMRQARTVLWRTHFAHLAAAQRYLDIARTTDVKEGGNG